tara:strand:- start:454 stop:735 length:282 start_codon:yes stop_codon:yes gene_type:complete
MGNVATDLRRIHYVGNRWVLDDKVTKVRPIPIGEPYAKYVNIDNESIRLGSKDFLDEACREKDLFGEAKYFSFSSDRALMLASDGAVAIQLYH